MSGAWTTPKTWTAGVVLTKAELDEQVRDNELYLKTHIALEAAAALTISAGAVTVTQAHHKVAGEGAADDELDTINGGAEGMVVFLRADGNRIMLMNGTGNLVLAAHLVLFDGEEVAIQHDGTSWRLFSPQSGLRPVSGALAESGQHGKIFSWQNTTGKTVMATSRVQKATGSTAAAKINVGQAATEIESDNIIDGAALQAAGLLNEIKHAGTNGLGWVLVADDEWITGFEDNSADPADVVGNYYIFFMPVG